MSQQTGQPATQQQRHPQPSHRDWVGIETETYDQTKHNGVVGRAKSRRKAIAVDRLPFDEIDSLLDVGVGSGEMLAEAYASGVDDLTGVDINPEFLAAVDDVATTHQADAADLPLPDNSQDAAVCLAVLGHLPTEADARAAVEELVRVVKPEGRIIVSVGNDGLARRVRDGWQRARSGLKDMTGLGEPEPWFESHGAATVLEAADDAGAHVAHREYIGLLPGLGGRGELALERALDGLMDDGAAFSWGQLSLGPSRSDLARTTVMELRVMPERIQA